MIKEALQYIVGLGKAEEHMINGACYSDKPLHRIDTYYPKADAIEMHTLTSLVDYIKSEVDEMPPRMIVEVKSPTEVELYSQLDANRDRESLVVASARVPDFEFDRFVEREKFCINLQSKFLKNDDRELILKFAGTVEAGSVSEYGDDGVTQKATIKTGLASKSDAIVPNPVCLRPYRTFLEVEQPESAFVFRMKQNNYGDVMCAVFEADGGAWKIDATQAIKEYLQRKLDGMSQFTVIS